MSVYVYVCLCVYVCVPDAVILTRSEDGVSVSCPWNLCPGLEFKKCSQSQRQKK